MAVQIPMKSPHANVLKTMPYTEKRSTKIAKRALYGKIKRLRPRLL
jgi:hypothetical protein